PICAAPLRHDLHAVHVRQGQPDPARARVSAGVHPAAGAPAATSAERPCQHSTSPSGNPAATSSWTFAVTLGGRRVEHEEDVVRPDHLSDAWPRAHASRGLCQSRRIPRWTCCGRSGRWRPGCHAAVRDPPVRAASLCGPPVPPPPLLPPLCPVRRDHFSRRYLRATTGRVLGATDLL